MTSENKAIEQLWYTWSDVGIDNISAGDRIRAASAGLRDLRSELIRRLNPYQRYFLPRDAHPSIDHKLAPICLALIDTGKERILVHKVYTGRDGVGRYGAFFVHLLANLPEDFSLIDAISLWQSPFWKKSDVKDRNTELERVSLAVLRQQQKIMPPDPQSEAKIRNYLPSIVEAYLTKNLLREKLESGSEQQKIYIAASDNDVALLISGLIHSLPAQLVQDLTFSTYEPDVNEAKAEIVGTCWLKDQVATHLLPAHAHYYEKEKLAFNCYTGMFSPLMNHPLVLNHPFSAQCAQDATEYFLNSHNSLEFQDLLDTARDYSDLSVKKFLELYEMIVIRAKEPSQSDVETALTPRTPREYEISAKLLSRSAYRHALIRLVVNVPNWWATHKKALSDLRQHSSQVPMLAQALSNIVQIAALPIVIGIVKREADPTREVNPGDEVLFRNMVDMMRCAMPLEEEPSVWHTLLNELLRIRQTQDFLHNHRSIYAELMRIWSITLPPSEGNNKLISPLLTISWTEFGDFLTLGLPLNWVEIATKELVYHSSLPSKTEIHHLEQQYHPYIKNLLQQLSQHPQRWSTATALFDTLIKGIYQEKMSLLFVLLDSPMGKQESSVKTLLQRNPLTPYEIALFLEKYGPYYLPDSKLTKIVLNMFAGLASSDLQKAKMRVLFGWLASSRLFPWFDSPEMGEKNLAKVLTKASLNTSEIGEFFQYYGEKYITLYPWSPALVNLFGSYAKNATQLRMPLLNTWLKCNLQEETLTHMLDATHLTSDEQVSFLQHYGERYLSRYPQSQFLASYVEEFLKFVCNSNIATFKESPSPKEPSATERLLGFLCNSSLPYVSREHVCDWYNAARFVRQPSLLKKEWGHIAQAIGRLVSTPSVMSTALLKELAAACITNENEVTSLIARVRRVLAPPVMLQLFDNIAKSVSDGIYQRRYAKTLYIPCIQSALAFQAAFHQQAEQESFVNGFLNTLLQNADERTLNWLNTQAKRLPTNFSTALHRYTSQRSSSNITTSLVALSLFEHIELFWERTIAFSQMRRALKYKGMERVLQVGTDYITTLSSYPKEVPNEYWLRLDEILVTMDDFGENAWNQYEAERYHITVAQAHHTSSKPLHLARIRSWWKRTVAFTQIQLALRSGKIGRIVRVVTEHMITLDRYGTKVPDKWWWQIDTAFDIFIALEVEYKGTDKDRNREQDIVDASQKMDQLVLARHPSPRLTLHEWRRIKIAMHHVANQKAQKMLDNQKQQKLSTQQEALVSQPTKLLPSDTVPVKKAKQGIFRRLTLRGKNR